MILCVNKIVPLSVNQLYAILYEFMMGGRSNLILQEQKIGYQDFAPFNPKSMNWKECLGH
jgi:hypothetical protein